MEIGAEPKKPQELGLVVIGMYCVHPIFKDEDSRIINGQPPHQAIMKSDEGSLSNPKGVKVKGGVFMTPYTLSHQVGQFKQGGTMHPHVWEEKGCPLSPQERNGRNSSSCPSFVVVLRA